MSSDTAPPFNRLKFVCLFKKHVACVTENVVFNDNTCTSRWMKWGSVKDLDNDAFDSIHLWLFTVIHVRSYMQNNMGNGETVNRCIVWEEFLKCLQIQVVLLLPFTSLIWLCYFLPMMDSGLEDYLVYHLPVYIYFIYWLCFLLPVLDSGLEDYIWILKNSPLNIYLTKYSRN